MNTTQTDTYKDKHREAHTDRYSDTHNMKVIWRLLETKGFIKEGRSMRDVSRGTNYGSIIHKHVKLSNNKPKNLPMEHKEHI